MGENVRSIFRKYKANIIVSAVTSAVCFMILFLLAAGYFGPAFDSLLNVKSAFFGQIGLSKSGAANDRQSVVDIVDKANPAVVSIVITKNVPIIEQYYQEYSPFGGDDFFRDFFGGGFTFRIPQQRQKGVEKREVGGGSGFFVSSDGLLVTNRHVVEDQNAEYTVLTNDGKKYEAKILVKDAMLDIAVLKVNAADLPFLDFGDSDLLKPGQTVIVIGNALGEFRNSVSVGVVSGLSRSIVAGDPSGNSEKLQGVIQTDAAINPGNSGGPLLDLSGRVVGINVAVERGAENIGFAIPSNTIKGIVEKQIQQANPSQTPKIQ